jgi:hypothetical protein
MATAKSLAEGWAHQSASAGAGNARQGWEWKDFSQTIQQWIELWPLFLRHAVSPPPANDNPLEESGILSAKVKPLAEYPRAALAL